MEIPPQHDKEERQMETRTLATEEGKRNPALGPADQILAGSRKQANYAFGQNEATMPSHPYLTDVGTLSRSMTALGLSNTIPEEPADMDLDSGSLLNARRIASKSAIDLVGLNEGEVFDANAPLGGEFGGGLGMGVTGNQMQASVDNGFSFQVTMMPSRCIIVSNLSQYLDDDSVRVIFQMSGDIQSIRSEYRLQGIAQVTYYDIRSAVAAREQLNGSPLGGQYLNVQFVTTPGSVGSFSEGTLVVFNVDPKLDAQGVAAHFSIYGDVKRVQSIPEKENHRLVEFYDLRHAHAAMEALNKTDALKLKSSGLSTGLKQTMSLQQLARGSIDSEQEEDQSSRSWDGSAQAAQQMDALMRMNEPTTPSRFFPPSTGGLTKSMSIGSGLGDVRGASDLAPETPTSQVNRAVQLTPELAEGLRISDSASSLGGSMFPGPTAATGLNVSPKIQAGGLGSFGTSSVLGGFNRGGLSNSSSVETGLDAYGQHTLANPGLDAGLTQFPQQAATQFNPGLGIGMGSAGLNPLGYLNAASNANAAALLAQAGNGNLLQAVAYAQATGQNIYEVLARLPNNNPGNLSHLLAASRAGLTHPTGTGTSLLGSLTSSNTSRMSTMQSLPTAQTLVSGGLSSPSYGISSTTPGSTGLSDLSISKSASSPALHASTEDRESTAHRFGGRLSRRNVDPLIEAERRAQQQRLYALDLDKIRRKEDKRTTLMIKNIPNKYTQKMLLSSIDETLKGTYDFFYLPIDFKNKCNVGYGFINMREPEDIVPLVERFHNKKWERFNSEKICCVAYGRIQGKQALINHFQNSSLMHEDKKHRPVLFVTDGPNKGEPEPFPVGANVRPKIALKERDFRSRERSGHWT